MSGENPRADRKTPVEGGRKAALAPPAKLPPPAVSPKPTPISTAPPVPVGRPTPPLPAPAKLPAVVPPPKRETPAPAATATPALAPTPRPAAGNNPFLDEAGVSPSSRVKKPKPPPGIITAGGVDMARGHAANIQTKPSPEAKAPDGPKVVVAVETDPRRVRTGPRLVHSGQPPESARSPVERTLESARPPPVAGPSPWATGPAEVLDKKALPSANLPVAVPAKPEEEEQKKGAPIWLRVAAALAVLFLGFAVVQRFVLKPSTGEQRFGPASSSIGVAPPLPDEPTVAATATAPLETAALAALPAPPSVDSSAVPAAEPSAAPSTDPSVDPSAGAMARPRVAAPPPPKPTFKPLFELPQEKTKE